MQSIQGMRWSWILSVLVLTLFLSVQLSAARWFGGDFKVRSNIKKLTAAVKLDDGEDAVRQMESLVSRVDQVIEDARANCASGETKADGVRSDLSKLNEEVSRYEKLLASLRQGGEGFQPQLVEIKHLQGRLREAGVEVTRSRDRVNGQAGEACEKSGKVSKSLNSSQRQLLLAEIQQVEQQIESERTLALAAYNKAFPSRERIDAIYELAANFQDGLESTLDDIADLEVSQRKVDQGLQEVIKAETQAISFQDHLEDLAVQAEDLLTEAEFLSSQGMSKRQELKILQEDLVRIQTSIQSFGRCGDVLSRTVELLRESVGEHVSRYDDLYADAEDLVEQFRNNTLSAFADAKEDADAKVSVMDDFMDEIDSLLKSSKSCRETADAEVRQPITIKVPDLRGLRGEEALDRLLELQLKGRQLDAGAPPSREQSYTVKDQLPWAGHDASPGDEISVVVYGAFEGGALVPDVLGLTVDQARQRLDRAGLRIALRSGDPARSSEDEDTVQRQYPEAGSVMDDGFEVEVFLFTAAPKRVRVPNLQGVKQQDVERILSREGLTAVFVEGDPTDDIDSQGKVQYQEPRAGKEVQKGSEVRVVLFRAITSSDLWELPSVKGLTQQSAVDRLDAAGFSSSVRRGKPAPRKELEGIVYSQRPGAQKGRGNKPLVELKVYDRIPDTSESDEQFPSSVQEKSGPVGVYVACRTYFPRPAKEEGVRYKDWVKGVNAADVSYEQSDNPVFLHLTQAGLLAYPMSYFQPGKRISCPIEVSLTDRTSGSQVNFRGALLLEVIRSFDNYQSFTKTYSPKKFASSGQDISFLRFDSSGGTFQNYGDGGTDGLSYRGGPLVQGWPPNMRASNLRLFKDIVEYFDCFIATAAYGNRLTPELTILRGFRDNVLMKTFAGRRLIEKYYRYGPPASMKVRSHPLVQRSLRVALAPLAWTLERLDLQDEHTGRLMYPIIFMMDALTGGTPADTPRLEPLEFLKESP